MADPNSFIKIFKLDDQEPCVVVIPTKDEDLKLLFQMESEVREVLDHPFPQKAIDLLLKYRLELEGLFQDCGNIDTIARVIWDEISNKITEHGFHVTSSECSKEWENLRSYYITAIKNGDANWKYLERFNDTYRRFNWDSEQKIQSDQSIPDSKKVVQRDVRVTPPKNVSIFDSALYPDVGSWDVRCHQQTNGRTSNSISACKNVDLSDTSNTQSKDIQSLDSAKLVAASTYGHIKSLEPVKKVQRRKKSLKKLKSSEIIPVIRHTEFCWDADSTQCFLDLRLYMERRSFTAEQLIEKYKTINRFVSKKMSQLWCSVTEMDCRKKWTAMKMSYEQRSNIDQETQDSKRWFAQMNRILGGERESIGEFCWTEESTRLLISIRLPMENAFIAFKAYIVLWDYVASQMAFNKHNPTSSQCSAKWMELCERYETCLESMKNGDWNIDWIFFQIMHSGFTRIKRFDPLVDYATDNTDMPRVILKNQNTKMPATKRWKIQTENQVSRAVIAKNKNEVGMFNSKDRLSGETRRKLIELQTQQKSQFENLDVEQQILWEALTLEMQTTRFAVSNLSAASYLENLVMVSNLDMKTSRDTATADEECVDFTCESNAEFLNDADHNSEICYESANDFQTPSTAMTPVKRKFVWTEEATKLLIDLKFSDNLWKVKKYGVQVARAMNCRGYQAVTNTDCARKWSRLMAQYKKFSMHRESRIPIKWKYFEAMEKGIAKARSMEANDHLTGDDNMKFTQMDDRTSTLIESTTVASTESQNCEICYAIPILCNQSEGDKINCAECTTSSNPHVQSHENTYARLQNQCRTDLESCISKNKQVTEIGEKYCENNNNIGIDRNLSKNTDLGDKYEIQHIGNADCKMSTSISPANSQDILEIAISNVFSPNDFSEQAYCVPLVSEKTELDSTSTVNSMLPSMPLKNDDTTFRKRGNRAQSFSVTKRWTKTATKLLIDLRQRHEEKYPNLGHSVINWDELAAQMNLKGYHYTHNDCRKKWNSLIATYQNKIQDAQVTGAWINWPYFTQIDYIVHHCHKLHHNFRPILPKRLHQS